jgi:hypothetical protein
MAYGFTVAKVDDGLFLKARKATIERLTAAMAKATDQSAALGRADIQSAMSSAGLGNLGRAIRYTSDLKKKRVPNVTSGGEAGFRVGATIFAPSTGNERVNQALHAYTQGATIVPRRGKWLAIATDEIPRLAGRRRMTPELYDKLGYDRRIGPLEFIPSKHPNEALLIVRDVSVNGARGFGRARRLPRHGNPGEGRKAVDFIVAFILIRVTSRAGRFNPGAIFKARVEQIPAEIRRFMVGRQSGSITSKSIASSSSSFSYSL